MGQGGMEEGPGYRVQLYPGLEEEYSAYLEVGESEEGSFLSTQTLVSNNTRLNIAILSILLVLGLTTNILAFPVIMFRRTRFGNGQFAVLVLCLTIADLLTVLAGLVGGLALEIGHMSWSGDSLGCQLYYFLTSWLLGLANYLVAVLLSLLHVKRSTGWMSRLAECRSLLLLLSVSTLIPSLPQLWLRSTVHLGPDLTVCIISLGPTQYGVYTGVKLVMLHLLPSLVVIISLLKPRTKVAKRLSAIFLGGAITCECGPGGQELGLPHSCPKMGDRCLTPDLVTGHTSSHCSSSSSSHPGAKQSLVEGRGGQARTKLITVREDPHRRRYKLLLSILFLSCSLLYLVLEVALQVQSLSVSEWEEVELGADLATALLCPTYLKQILNPLLLLYIEFWHT